MEGAAPGLAPGLAPAMAPGAGPGAAPAMAPGIAPAPVMVESAPQAQRFSVEATLTRKEPLSDPIERRVIKSSQTFIARLRRDLIPQEAPAEEPEGSE